MCARPSASSSRALWARTAGLLHCVELDGIDAVFDPLTGETFFLNELPTLLLELLAERPHSIDEILSRLQSGQPLGVQERERVQMALEFLEQSELVQSIPN